MRAHAVRTIYSETLVSPAVADTLARETGARTAVLDPVEGLTDASAGSDYLAVMRANLAHDTGSSERQALWAPPLALILGVVPSRRGR